MTIVGAMHHGVPVIASAIGGASEVLTHRRTGWLLPPGDEDALTAAMIALPSDRSERAQLAAAGASQHVLSRLGGPPRRT